MKRKMSNMTKDKIFILFVIFIILLFLTLIIIGVKKIFAESHDIELTQSQINKYYAEETIKNEMSFLSMWDYVEKMSEQEYYDTFYKNDCAEYEYVMKKEKEEVKKCQKN